MATPLTVRQTEFACADDARRHGAARRHITACGYDPNFEYRALLAAFFLYPPKGASIEDLDDLVGALIDADRVTRVKFGAVFARYVSVDAEEVVFEYMISTLDRVRARQSTLARLLAHRNLRFRRRVMVALPRIEVLER